MVTKQVFCQSEAANYHFHFLTDWCHWIMNNSNDYQESALEKELGIDSATIFCIILFGMSFPLIAFSLFLEHKVICIPFILMTILSVRLGGGFKLFLKMKERATSALKLLLIAFLHAFIFAQIIQLASTP